MPKNILLLLFLALPFIGQMEPVRPITPRTSRGESWNNSIYQGRASSAHTQELGSWTVCQPLPGQGCKTLRGIDRLAQEAVYI